MASDKVEVTQGPATDESIKEFHEFRDGMQGDAYQGAARFEPSSRGFGSGVDEADKRSSLLPEGEPPPPEEQGFAQPEGAEQPSKWQQWEEGAEQNWKKLYGESENQKGEWRRTAEEALGQLNQIKGELAALRAAQAMPAYPTAAPPAGVPVASGPPPGYTQPQEEPIRETFFPEKGENDLIEAKDVDAALRRYVAPAVLAVEQQQRVLYQQQVQSAKTAAGLTPEIEQRMLTSHPWLASVPDGPARIQAMREVASRGSAPQVQPKQPQPAQAQVNPSQAAARRVTYIESGRPGGAQAAEDGRPTQEIIARELAEARAKGGAKAMRAVLGKYGMDQVNDWGPDVWGPAR